MELQEFWDCMNAGPSPDRRHINPLLAHIDEISPRPILFVVGDRAHSRFFSENAYAAALEPKELYEVADAEQY